MPGDLLSSAEVAVLRSVPIRTVSHAARRGDFPGAILVGKSWVIPRSAAMQWKPQPRGRPAVGSSRRRRNARKSRGKRAQK